MNWTEQRISNAIQRDMWSALKYALRFAQLIERKELIDASQKNVDWKPMMKKLTGGTMRHVARTRPRVIGWKGGRIG